MRRNNPFDAHTIMRDGPRVALEKPSLEVTGEAASPMQASSELARLRPDVNLLGLRLGERSGFELLSTRKQRALDLPVIALSMPDQPRLVTEALRLGARGYVLKSFAGSEMLQAVEAVATSRSLLSQQAIGPTTKPCPHTSVRS